MERGARQGQWYLASVITGLLSLCLLIAIAAPVQAQLSEDHRRWVTAWAAAQMVIAPGDSLVLAGVPSATLRQTVLMTQGGQTIRLRLSNRYGTAPLEILGVHVARAPAAGSAAILAGTDRVVSFSGQAKLTIPAGADAISDSVALPVAALSHVSVSIHLAQPSGPQTGHPGSRTHSHLLAGDHLSAPDLPGATRLACWLFISAIDVASDGGSAIAILGDSITDGYGVTPDSDGRWPDYLAKRIQADATTRHLSVLNLGIGGNRLLLNEAGPNAMARFDRDILGLSAVRYVIVLIGVNDLGVLTRDLPASAEAHRALTDRMIAAYRQMVLRAREKGVRVIGATILPYGASGFYHPDATNEADRKRINEWIRAPGNVDAVLDFDALARDPERPERMRADFDSGDGLHPSDEGYRAMADGVPLGLFRQDAPQLVLTFDDLPQHGELPKGESALSIALSIIATLKEKGVREAYGFINAGQIVEDASLKAVLDLWHKSGLGIGNHSWSHARLDDLTPAGFTQELLRNAEVIDSITGGGRRYYRYPFLAEGNDPALRDAARQIMADHGHAIAPVSIDTNDWAYNGPYARCLSRGDAEGVATLERIFLARAEASAQDARAQAQTLYGRDIPYVALLHSGAFTARMLPRLLALYARMGFRFANLADALEDPAYAAAHNPALPFEPSTLRSRFTDWTPVKQPIETPEPETICVER